METRVIKSNRTPLRIDAMMEIGAAAYHDVFDRSATTFELATAASQWSTECGIQKETANLTDGCKVIWSIWNNNCGNITCRANADCDKHWFVTKERVKKGKTPEEDVWKDLKLYYKAYESPREGSMDYWKKMVKYFPKSLQSFKSGDMKLVAQTLSNEGYYTDLVSKYEKNLNHYFPRYLKLLCIGKEVL